MSEAGKLVKDLVKAKKESVMGKLANGDDPMEPWSKRFDAPIKEEDLNEDTWLYRYVRSLGWDPQHMTFAQQSKYSRSNAFKTWKKSHMERGSAMEEAENLDEAGTGLLMSYIKSKGLDPRLMDGNQKSAYSKSSEFRIFKNRHVKEVSGMGERGDDWNEEKKAVKEAVDAKDTVTMDIPLLIRVLEYAREDAKTDMDLHKVVENLINMRGEGSLSMAMYDKIVAIKEELEKLGEETEQIDELSKGTLTSYATKARADAANLSKQGDAASKRTSTKSLKTALDKFRKAAKRNIAAAGAESKARVKEEVEQVDEMKKQNDNMEIDDRITREEKKMKGPNPCWKGYQMVGTKKKGGRTVPNCVPEETEIAEGVYGIEDSPLSATNSVKAMESTGRKKQMTKSARMIKSIYKKKNVKETMYDWEKSEKGGKVVDEPTAKVIMKGGTTMTGKPRDTIEIEPVLRTKLNRPAGTNPSA